MVWTCGADWRRYLRNFYNKMEGNGQEEDPTSDRPN